VVGKEPENGSPCGDDLVEQIGSRRFGASASEIHVAHVVRMPLGLERLAGWLLV
jgi:hypothetical protein